MACALGRVAPPVELSLEPEFGRGHGSVYAALGRGRVDQAGLRRLLVSRKAYLRHFDQEHFHRFAKVYLGLQAAHLTSAAATDRWVALVLAAYAQLRIASPLGVQLCRPWHPRPHPGTIVSPYRTRLGFAGSVPSSGPPPSK